jgi:hypothetical protein
MRRHGSVQEQHVQVAAIEGGVLRLADGRCRAVLEVSGVAFSLLGEAEQEALLAGYAAWLNSLAFPLQVLVRVLPLDLDGYLAGLERRARQELPAVLALLAEDHGAFLRQLAQERLLLERRHYVVLPADEPPPAGPSRWPWPWRRRGPQLALDSQATLRQLTARCDETCRRLADCGLVARRLDSLELARLFHACWRPEQSRVERLRAELVEADTLAVCHPASPKRRCP